MVQHRIGGQSMDHGIMLALYVQYSKPGAPAQEKSCEKSLIFPQKSVDLPPRLCYSMHYLSDERCFFRAHFLPEDALRSIQGGNARVICG